MSERIDKIYSSVNRRVLDCVPAGARRVLDVGCGDGSFAQELKRRTAASVVGLTHSAAEAEIASQWIDRVEVTDLNTYDFKNIGTFDCAILSHVLEHLYHPEEVLGRMRVALDPGAIVIVALPNVLIWKQRMQFLLGRFEYQEYGVMDRTHYRFFNSASASQLLQRSGYELIARVDEGHFPLRGIRRVLPGLSRRMDRAVARALPGLFADQFVLVARSQASK
jgi:2-polyprenyl-3-methyl-5-hydroxy-6-metoxy-1,4-benzoquinol methylase